MSQIDSGAEDAPSGSGRTALLPTLCVRIRPPAGAISTRGFENGARSVFKNSSVAAFPGVDEVVQSIGAMAPSARRNRQFTMERLYPPIEV